VWWSLTPKDSDIVFFFEEFGKLSSVDIFNDGLFLGRRASSSLNSRGNEEKKEDTRHDTGGPLHGP